MLRWYEAGYLAVDAQVFDVGVTTGQALLRLRGGLAAIPARWRDGLRGADLVKPLLVQLLAWRA